MTGSPQPLRNRRPRVGRTLQSRRNSTSNAGISAPISDFAHLRASSSGSDSTPALAQAWTYREKVFEIGVIHNAIAR